MQIKCKSGFSDKVDVTFDIDDTYFGFAECAEETLSDVVSLIYGYRVTVGIKPESFGVGDSYDFE